MRYVGGRIRLTRRWYYYLHKKEKEVEQGLTYAFVRGVLLVR